MRPEFNLKSAMVQDKDSYIFTFFCDLCDRGYTTSPLVVSSVREARRLAENEARLHFNRCHSCRKWVCDRHYNEDEMMCSVCAPRLGKD